MEIETVDMTTPANVAMIKELRSTLEALTAERVMDEHDDRKNPVREAATNAAMMAIECFCLPLMRCMRI
jgi:hypothetical protein